MKAIDVIWKSYNKNKHKWDENWIAIKIRNLGNENNGIMEMETLRARENYNGEITVNWKMTLRNSLITQNTETKRNFLN